MAEGKWQEDPTRKHELRYHDGTRWTDHVSDAGEVDTDPLKMPGVTPGGTKVGGLKVALLLFLGAIVVLAGVGAALDSGQDPKPSASKTTPATPPKHPTATPHPKPDTGRMSGDEYTRLKAVTNRFAGEAYDYNARVGGKCLTLVQAGELADASNCINDAYDGVDTATQLAYTELADDIKATAKSCQKATRKLRSAVETYREAMAVTRKLGENLSTNVDLNRLAAKQVATRQRSFETRRGNAFQRCAPG